MHETAGYTFSGDAPIAGLTPNETRLLMLGFLRKEERKREAHSDESPERRKRKRGRKARAREAFAETGAVA